MLCISDFTCAAQGYPEVHPCPAINRGGEHLLTHLCQTQLSPSKIVLSTGPPDSAYIMIWCPMSALPTLWVYSDEDDGDLRIIYSFIDLRPPPCHWCLWQDLSGHWCPQTPSSADNMSGMRRDSHGTQLSLHSRKQHE